jgi:hypothetical protein
MHEALNLAERRLQLLLRDAQAVLALLALLLRKHHLGNQLLRLQQESGV